MQCTLHSHCEPRASWRRGCGDAYQRVRKANQGQESDPVERRGRRALRTAQISVGRLEQFQEDCLLRVSAGCTHVRDGGCHQVCMYLFDRVTEWTRRAIQKHPARALAKAVAIVWPRDEMRISEPERESE